MQPQSPSEKRSISDELKEEIAELDADISFYTAYYLKHLYDDDPRLRRGYREAIDNLKKLQDKKKAEYDRLDKC
jgi:septal ring factor EnvC (AmiA/AmiB activator)